MHKAKIKQFLFIIATIFYITIPAFFLTACGGNSSGDSDSLMNIYIMTDNNPDFLSQTAYIDETYGVRLSDILQRVSYVFEFSNGKKKNKDELTEAEIEKILSLGEPAEKYYLGSYPENGGDAIWTEVEEISQNIVLDVGMYKIVYMIAGRGLELQISIQQSEEDTTNLRISVVPNSSSSYNSNSNYKFGCPTYQNYQFNPATYTSDYKVQVYDYKTNKIVSGSKVTKVYALPQTAPEDNTIQSWWDGVSDVEIHAGDNLIIKYDEINCENSYSKKSMQQNFLSSYVQEITITNYNDAESSTLMYDDSTMVVNTESLKPGRYYLIAEYHDENHTGGYTTPKSSNTLEVKKGDFVWKNTIHKDCEDYNEAEATNFIKSLTFNIDYWFNTSIENPLFTVGTEKALPMDLLKTLTIDINSTYPEIDDPHQPDGRNVWQNYMNSSPVCIGGRGAFGWYKLELTGKKYLEGSTNGTTVVGLDCSDMENGSIKLQAKIKFDDEYSDLKDYYNEDQTIYPVIVTLHKGRVSKPTIKYIDGLSERNGKYSFEYNGQMRNLEVEAGYENSEVQFFTISGDRLATNVGNSYTLTYKLKDNVNYEIDDCESDQVEFNWEIRKITLNDVNEEFTTSYLYNNIVVENEYGNINDCYITYVPGAENKIIATVSSEKYTIIKTAAVQNGENVSMQYVFEDDNCPGVIGKRIVLPDEENGLVDGQFIFEFDGCESDSSYVTIHILVGATSVSENYTSHNALQIFIEKLAYTEEELAEIYGTSFEKNNDNHYTATFNIVVDGERKISSTAVPEVSTTHGVWKIYYVDNGNYVEVIPSETVLPDFVGCLVYRFVSNDNMYEDIGDVSVNI